MDTQELQRIKNRYDIIGNNAGLNYALETALAVAPSDLAVLVTGESGVGKDAIARIIHDNSRRKTGPYLAINCGAIPSGTINAELFGHEKGAFTSAVKQHKGKFEQADGGTLFLDEIGDMSLAAQAKVLRVLQEKKLSRVGSDKDIMVDVRVLAATNKNLREEIEKGRFREDHYHRLSVIVITVPSLDERKEDIPLLVEYFINQICSETGMHRRNVEPEAMRMLVGKTWTGNIRELRNVVERLLILSGERITADDVRAYVL